MFCKISNHQTVICDGNLQNHHEVLYFVESECLCQKVDTVSKKESLSTVIESDPIGSLSICCYPWISMLTLEPNPSCLVLSKMAMSTSFKVFG